MQESNQFNQKEKNSGQWYDVFEFLKVNISVYPREKLKIVL